MMKIGFIIVTNQSDIREQGHSYATRCIDSIKNNIKLYDYEIILIDNGSDVMYNGSFDKNINYIYRKQQPGGLIRAWNYGVNIAYINKCNYYVILNDDVYFNETLDKFFTAVNQHEFRNISYYAPVCNNPKTFSWQRMPYSPGVMKELTSTADGPHGYFISFNEQFRQKFSKQLLMFDERKPFAGQEILFHSRIKSEGGKSFAVGDCEMFHDHLATWRKLPTHITHK